MCLVLWNTGSYMFKGNTPVCSVSSIAIIFLVLCFFYKGNVGCKILLIIAVIVTGMMSEEITVFLFKVFRLPTGENCGNGLDFAVLASGISKIICFMLVKVMVLFALKQKHVRVKIMDWAEVFLVPAVSITVCCTVWWDKERYVTALQILILSVLLIINLSVYYMYQQIQLHIAANAENEVLKRQNEYFRVRDEDFEQQWLKLRRMRHNMTNNRVLEMDYLERGEYELLMQYYREQVGKINPQGMVYTGNIGIDSIVNYKLEAAGELCITVDKTIEIAGKVKIDNIDLNNIVGNLMDNAIEAVREMDVARRKITLIMRADKTAFFLEIRNPFEGERLRNKTGDFMTWKKDSINHGLGLLEVKEIARKYGGRFAAETKGNEFNIRMLLYMDTD